MGSETQNLRPRRRLSIRHRHQAAHEIEKGLPSKRDICIYRSVKQISDPVASIVLP